MPKQDFVLVIIVVFVMFLALDHSTVLWFATSVGLLYLLFMGMTYKNVMDERENIQGVMVQMNQACKDVVFE